jgi:hypothetical protein
MAISTIATNLAIPGRIELPPSDRQSGTLPLRQGTNFSRKFFGMRPDSHVRLFGCCGRSRTHVIHRHVATRLHTPWLFRPLGYTTKLLFECQPLPDVLYLTFTVWPNSATRTYTTSPCFIFRDRKVQSTVYREEIWEVAPTRVQYY